MFPRGQSYFFEKWPWSEQEDVVASQETHGSAPAVRHAESSLADGLANFGVIDRGAHGNPRNLLRSATPTHLRFSRFH
jgi:dihydroxyacetone kinase